MLNLPDFSAIQLNQIESQLDALLQQGRDTVQQLSELQEPTWQNFALPMQTIDQAIEDYFAPISHLNGVQNSQALRDVYQVCVEKLTAYSSELGQNAALFAQFQKLADSGICDV